MMHSPTQPTDDAMQGAAGEQRAAGEQNARGDNAPAKADMDNQVADSARLREALIRLIDELDRAIANWE